MNEIESLARRIDREKVERARGMTIAEKFQAGAELFEDACEVARSGIRSTHPAWSAEEVERELARRLEIGRKLEESLAR